MKRSSQASAILNLSEDEDGDCQEIVTTDHMEASRSASPTKGSIATGRLASQLKGKRSRQSPVHLSSSSSDEVTMRAQPPTKRAPQSFPPPHEQSTKSRAIESFAEEPSVPCVGKTSRKPKSAGFSFRGRADFSENKSMHSDSDHESIEFVQDSVGDRSQLVDDGDNVADANAASAPPMTPKSKISRAVSLSSQTAKTAVVAGTKRPAFSQSARRPTTSRYFEPSEPKRCLSCGELGHFARDCVSRLPCFLCGEKGHVPASCPNDLCIRCCQKGHFMRNCRNPRARKPSCVLCGSSRHTQTECTYEIPEDILRTTRCYVCGQAGHLNCSKIVHRPPKPSCANCAGHHTYERCPTRPADSVYDSAPFHQRQRAHSEGVSARFRSQSGGSFHAKSTPNSSRVHGRDASRRPVHESTSSSNWSKNRSHSQRAVNRQRNPQPVAAAKSHVASHSRAGTNYNGKRPQNDNSMSTRPAANKSRKSSTDANLVINIESNRVGTNQRRITPSSPHSKFNATRKSSHAAPRSRSPKRKLNSTHPRKSAMGNPADRSNPRER